MKLHFQDFEFPVEVELIAVDRGMMTLGYLSLIENKRYLLQTLIGSSIDLSIGTAPYGRVAIWREASNKKILIDWIKTGEELGTQKLSCVGLPPVEFFDNYMKQFTYRYQVLMEKWQGDEAEVLWEKYGEEEENVPEFEWIEESLYDGTHDKLHDGGLMQFHEAGKPKKLAIQFHKRKAEYTAYFWFEDEKIREVFDKFYGAHPETKTDFIIRMDAENKKYELALYRYGLKEPVVIKEDVYQLLVFKNKFEDYRSENYDQPRGAWIW